MKGYRKLRIAPSAAELAARRKREKDEMRALLDMMAQRKNATQPAQGPDVTGSVSIETAAQEVPAKDAAQP